MTSDDDSSVPFTSEPEEDEITFSHSHDAEDYIASHSLPFIICDIFHAYFPSLENQLLTLNASQVESLIKILSIYEEKLEECKLASKNHVPDERVQLTSPADRLAYEKTVVSKTLFAYLQSSAEMRAGTSSNIKYVFDKQVCVSAEIGSVNPSVEDVPALNRMLAASVLCIGGKQGNLTLSSCISDSSNFIFNETKKHIPRLPIPPLPKFAKYAQALIAANTEVNGLHKTVLACVGIPSAPIIEGMIAGSSCMLAPVKAHDEVMADLEEYVSSGAKIPNVLAVHTTAANSQFAKNGLQPLASESSHQYLRQSHGYSKISFMNAYLPEKTVIFEEWKSASLSTLIEARECVVAEQSLEKYPFSVDNPCDIYCHLRHARPVGATKDSPSSFAIAIAAAKKIAIEVKKGSVKSALVMLFPTPSEQGPLGENVAACLSESGCLVTFLPVPRGHTGKLLVRVTEGLPKSSGRVKAAMSAYHHWFAHSRLIKWALCAPYVYSEEVPASHKANSALLTPENLAQYETKIPELTIAQMEKQIADKKEDRVINAKKRQEREQADQTLIHAKNRTESVISNQSRSMEKTANKLSAIVGGTVEPSARRIEVVSRSCKKF